MKRRILVAMSAIALVFTMGISQSFAQNTTLDVRLAYGTEIENLGIGVGGEFFVTDNISIAPNLIYFFPKDLGGNGFEFDLKWFEINANGHYYFATGGAALPYGLAGINLAFVSVDSDIIDDSTTEVGLNLGVGSNFDIGSSIMPFAEIRFVIGDADQFVFSGGVRIPIGG